MQLVVARSTVPTILQSYTFQQTCSPLIPTSTRRRLTASMSNPSLDRKCFLPLSDINLPSSFTLHPKSANPCHDLVALYRPLSDAEATANEPHVPAFLQARMAQQAAKEKADSFLPSMVKGKQKEDNSKQKMRIGLWRAFSGVHVWDVDITGNAILGLAWSLDGTFPGFLSNAE